MMPSRAWLAILLLCVLALSACQGAGTRPIIKIGLSAPFTGADESVGYSVVGAVRLAIRERNQAGGVAGYSVELVALDDANQPRTAAQRAREMIIDPAVMAVIGGFDAAAATAAASEYAGAGLPFVILAPYSAEDKRSFHLSASASETGRRAAEFAQRSLGARRLAIVNDETVASAAAADAFAAAATADGTIIVSRRQIERWQLDFAVAVRDLAATAPDLVFFSGRALEAGEFVKQMRAAGVAAAFLGGPDVDDARFGRIAGPSAGDAFFVSPGLALPQVTDAQKRAQIRQYALRPAGSYTVAAYDGTQLLLSALELAITHAGKPARAGVAAALRAIEHTGLSGQIAFDAQGERRAVAVYLYAASADSYPAQRIQ